MGETFIFIDELCNREIKPLLWFFIAKDIFLIPSLVTSPLHLWAIAESLIPTIDDLLESPFLYTLCIWSQICEYISIHVLIDTWEFPEDA